MSNLSSKEQRALIIAFTGFCIAVISFIIGAMFGKGSFPTILFYVGFTITAIGVLIGFFTFKQDE